MGSGLDQICNPGLVLTLGGGGRGGGGGGGGGCRSSSYSSSSSSSSGVIGARAHPTPLLSLGLSCQDQFSGAVKRERDGGGGEESMEVGRAACRASDEDDDGSNTRKKLRLTKAQSALLEESFKQHITLNPKEKQILATELNLRPRQVEVWFQNRRARTKLKQTEVDCELLKRWCETLTDENRKLQREVQELKALNLPPPPPLYMQLPAATLSMCPSCERVGAPPPKGVPFSMTQKPHVFNPFAKPSAAC